MVDELERARALRLRAQAMQMQAQAAPAQDDSVGGWQGLGNQIVAGFRDLRTNVDEQRARRLMDPDDAMGQAELYGQGLMDPDFVSPEASQAAALGDVVEQRLETQERFPMSDRSRTTVETLMNPEGDGFLEQALDTYQRAYALGGRNLGQAAVETVMRELPTLTAGAVGTAATRNPAVGAGVMGGMDFARVRDDQSLRVAQNMGYDISTDEGRAAAVADPNFHATLEREGLNQGAVAGGASLLSGLVSGLPMGRSPVVNVANQTAAQAGIGAASDAGMSAVVGEMPNPGSMTLSALADAAMATPQMVAVGGQYQQQMRDAFAKLRERGGNPDAMTVDDVVSDAFDGDPTANEFLRDIGLDPDNLPNELRARAEERLAARRETEAGRDLAAPPDPEQARAEREAIEAGEMDPAAASTVGRTAPEAIRDTIPMPEIRPAPDREREPIDPNQAATEAQRARASTIAQEQAAADAEARRQFDLARYRHETGRPMDPPQLERDRLSQDRLEQDILRGYRQGPIREQARANLAELEAEREVSRREQLEAEILEGYRQGPIRDQARTNLEQLETERDATRRAQLEAEILRGYEEGPIREQARANLAELEAERENTRRENMMRDARPTFDLAERRRQRMEETATPDTPPTSRDPRPAGRPEGEGTQDVTFLRTPEGEQPVQVAATLEDGSVIVVPMMTQTTGRREHQQQSLVMDEDAQPVRVPANQARELLSTRQWSPELRRTQEFQEAQQPRTRLSPNDVRPRQPGGGPQAGGDVTTRQMTEPRPASQETIPPDGPPPQPDRPRPTPEDAEFADMGTGRRTIGRPSAQEAAGQGPSAVNPNRPSQRDPRDDTVRPEPGQDRDGNPLGLPEPTTEPGRREATPEEIRQAQEAVREAHAAAGRGGDRPVATMMARSKPATTGGKSMQINPDGRLGKELRAAGITPRAQGVPPGLFDRRYGMDDADNLSRSEMEETFPGITEATGTARDADYLDRQGFIDYLTEELTQGSPLPEAQAVRDAEAELSEIQDRGISEGEDASFGDDTTSRMSEAERAEFADAFGDGDMFTRQSDMFDGDNRDQVGERQTDLEDLIAEANDAFEDGDSAAEVLFGEAGAKAAGEPRESPRNPWAREEQLREGVAAANREAMNDPNLVPDSELTPEQRKAREEGDYRIRDYLRDISDIPFSNPFFDPRLYRAAFNSLRAASTRLRNRLKGSTALTPPRTAAQRQAGRNRAMTLFHQFTATYHGYVSHLAEGSNSPTFDRIMGSIYNPPGRRTTQEGGTVRERIDAELAKHQNRYTKATSGLSNESKLRVVATLRGRKTKTPLTKAEQHAANEVRAVLNDMLGYMRDAGVEVGEVRRNYFPREYEEGAILADYDTFLDRTTQLYRKKGVSRADAREKAKALAHHLTTGDNSAFGGERANQQASIFKDREFGPQADQPAAKGGLAEFMSDDLDHIMSRYLTRGTRRAEIARQYGDQFSEMDKLTLQMVDEGVPNDAISALWDYARVQAGIVPAVSNNSLQFALSWMHTLGTMSLLDRATQTSFTEIYMAAIQSGGVSEVISETFVGVRDLMRHISRLGPTEKSKAAYELAEALGMVSTDSVMTAQIARHHGTDQVSRKQAEVLGHYFSAIQMTQFDNRNRMRAMLQGVKYLRKAARALDGNSALMSQDDGARVLSSLGIQEGDQKAVLDRLRSIEKDIPDPSDFSGREGELLQQALYRFANVWSVQRPTPAVKPAWANNPYGRIVFSLMSFPYSFTKNVIYHQLDNLKRSGQRLAKGEVMEAAGLATPAIAGAMWLVASRFLFDEMRDGFDEEVLGQDLPNMTDAARVERAVSRSGLTGGVDPIIQTLTGTRYNRGIADTALGPHFGALADSFDKGMNLAVNNNPDTFNAERQALNSAWFWGTGVAHGILSRYAPSPVAIAGMQALRGSRNDVLDAYTPTELNRGNFTPNQSIAEMLYYQWTGEEPPDHIMSIEEMDRMFESRMRARDAQFRRQHGSNAGLPAH